MTTPAWATPIYTSQISGIHGDGVTDDATLLNAMFASCVPGQKVVVDKFHAAYSLLLYPS